MCHSIINIIVLCIVLNCTGNYKEIDIVCSRSTHIAALDTSFLFFMY